MRIEKIKFKINQKEGLTLIEPLVACHSKPSRSSKLFERSGWQRKALGFTLIELLVVITIIAILIGAGTVSWSNAQQKSRDAKRKTDLKTIQQALEQYFQTNGHYPPYRKSDGAEFINWCTTLSNSNYLDPETGVYAALVPAFINKMPTDPVWGGSLVAFGHQKDYIYKKTAVGKYELAAVLENPNDPDKTGSHDYSGCEGGYNPYTYQVTQP